MYVDSDAEVAAARIGRTVGSRWRLERVLGIGGMAAVYQARDPNGTIAAVKILHPEMSARAEVRERFLREGYAANKIGHPGVVQALEHGDRDNDVFLAMELLEGETLRSRVKRHGRLPLAEVLDYADQILEVLVAAHARGVVHRDLKPDNLFVTNHGRIKVLDFGLARMLDGVPGQHRTRTGVALGTLAYMAPEQALGRRAEIDGRVDVFALGATMFRVLSGRRVHEAESEAELLMAMASRPAPPLGSIAPDVPPPVAAVVDLALAFSREARYPDAATMLADIRALRAGGAAPYASARLASRDEATRPDLPAVSPRPVAQRTQPLEAVPASSARPGTMPMSAYAPPSVPAPPPGFPPQEPPPISFRPPSSARADAQASPPNSLQGYAQPAPVVQPVYAAAAPGSPPPVAGAAPAKKSSLGLILVLGGLMVVGMAGLAFAFAFARSARELDAPVGPTRVSGELAASAAAVLPPAPALPAAAAPVAAEAQPAPPKSDRAEGGGAAAPAPDAPDSGGSAKLVETSNKKKAAAKPAPGPSAAAPAPSPSAAGAPTQSTAPSPAPAPSPVAPAPAPSPSVAPPPAPSPSASEGGPGKKAGKGKRPGKPHPK